MTRTHHLMPFLSVAAGIATFSVMDATMKSASIQAGVYNAMLLRAGIGSLLMLPLWLLAGGRWPRFAVLRIHALRAAVAAMMAALFFWGLVRLPMAEAMALSFISPLVALYLAAALLGETIRPAAILASLFGIAGVGVIAAGRLGESGGLAASAPGIAAVLASAVFYAWNLVLQRQQALLAGPVEVALFQNVFVGAILALAMAWFANWPTAGVLRDVTAGAVLAAVALMLLTWGYARAEAQALVPLEYTAFVWAALAGRLWFGEAVTAATVAGTVLIVFGCWIATRRTGAPHVPAANLPPAP
jgi:S-adenosylmethionine uptake transporter